MTHWPVWLVLVLPGIDYISAIIMHKRPQPLYSMQRATIRAVLWIIVFINCGIFDGGFK